MRRDAHIIERWAEIATVGRDYIYEMYYFYAYNWDSRHYNDTSLSIPLWVVK